ncbi:MAG: BsaWI family type II restriction enzyme [Alphaproteobacteria bacterium]
MQLLNKEEVVLFRSITEEIYYMNPVISTLENNYFTKYGILQSLDCLYEVIVGCKDQVEIMLEKRKSVGEIKDISQARKAVVGNIFPNTIVYIFLKAKMQQLVPSDLFVTTKTKNKLFEDYVTIHVGNETQKPDMDLVFYRVNDNQKISNCVIVSLKTSLRERAG